MDSESGSWWDRYGWTTTLLLTAFALSFIIRVIFSLSVFEQWGWLYVYGGGSDSFYHWRVTEFILTNHRNLVHDPLLKYPLGALNPREPLFDWMNAILGILFAPFFGGSAVNAAAFFLNVDPPLWSALTVFPIYLIGKEVSSKRMGLIAALTYPFIVGSIQAASLGYANYLTFYTFFILVYFYAYLRTAKIVSTKTYITSFRSPRSIAEGLRRLIREERLAVRWAVFTGVSLGALALAWQGYPLAVAIVVIFLGVIMVVERIRRTDSLNLYVVTWIAGLIGFPMAVPYYLAQGLFATWFDLPLLLYFGTLLVLLPFVLLRQYPWVVTVPMLAGIVVVGFGGLFAVAPASFETLITGQGYFAKTLIYSTVAEAQAPSFDSLVLSYGILTFFLAFVGLALFGIKLVRGRFRREHTLFVVFAIVSIYLPISAAKFFYVGSPAFALLPAEAILIILDVAGYAQLRRTTASLSGTRGQATAIRRAFKARHVLVLLLIVVLVVPNVWYAVDAGIPYNSKATYSTQVFDTLPPFLRTNSSNASSYYLGAAGTDLDTPNQYDEAGYNWLATQDTNLAPAARPAFISWWDYGFQAIAEGQHPSVADNFQNGIPAAGNFLLAQNESLAIGVLTVTLLQAEQQASGYAYLPPGLNAILSADGISLPELHTLLVNTSADLTLVINHPDRYLPVNPKTLTATNAMFDATSWFLATSLPESGVATVYNDVQAYTGWTIRYAMVDDRLFPFTGTNTGIFYAPADLTGRIIGADGAPTTYYTIEAVGSDGNLYPVNQVPPTVSVVNYVVNQEPPFYDSMLYRIYMGYNGTDVGLTTGIPGLEGSLTSYTPEPGWMLQHFEVAYRTAYYSPSSTASSTTCDIATNLPEAKILAAKTNGTANTGSDCYFNGGEAILEYYPGEPLSGTIALPDGTPVAGARLTVYDGWGIPHQTVLTGSDGSYSVILPPGNVTLNVTSGTLQGLAQNGTELLDSIHFDVNPALGFSLESPPISQNIVLQPGSVNGFVYWNATGNTTYEASQDPAAAGANVTLGGPNLHNYTATTDSGGSFRLANVAPGVYNFTVKAAGAEFSEGQVTVQPGRAASAQAGLVPSTLKGTVRDESGTPAVDATVTISAPAGVVETSTTNLSGGYKFANLVPGNYTVKAQAGVNLAANSTAVSLNRTTRTVTQNLTLIPVVPVDFEVEAGGVPVPGFVVRMTPIRETTGLLSDQSPRPSNGLVFVTDSTGYVHANVPAGNYSIYGYGPVGSSFLAGFESAYLPSTGTRIAVAPLVLSPSVELSGQSPTPAGVTSSDLSATQISVYDSAGNQLTFFANGTGSWSVAAPIGNYSVQALAVGVSHSTGNYSGVAYVDLSRSTAISLPLSPAFRFGTTVGTLLPGGTFYPSEAAQVHLTVNPTGATISSLTDARGNISFLLPTAEPDTTYCLSVQSNGYGGYGACSLSVGDLSTLNRVEMSLFNDTLDVSVTGLPSGAYLHLNATSTGPPAQSRSVTGGSTFSVSLAPGSYQITAWAPPSSGTGVLLPPESINVTLPLGAVTATLAVQLYRQVTATGVLNLPFGVTASAVHLRVYAPPFNFTVSGTAFESGFLIAPGSYSVYGSALVSGVNYSSLSQISVNATGVTSPAVTLGTGVSLVGTFVGSGGGPLNVTAPVYWSGPDGSQLYSLAVDGTVTLSLPGSATYTPSVNVTVAQSPNGVLRYATYTVVPGTSCVVGPQETSFCKIPLTVEYEAAGIQGQFYWNGAPLTISGTIQLMGPFPSTNVTVLTTSSGSFTAAVSPGIYTLYATAGTGAGVFASLSQVTVPFPSTNVTVTLSPAWTDTLTVLAPSGSAASPTANLTWTNSLGVSWSAVNVSLSSPRAWVLPQGVWAVLANGSVATYGRPVTAVANTTVSLLTGNQATNLVLSPRYTPSVSLATLAPISATVPDGGNATFSFTVANTGNVPVTISFYGDPAGWNFTFSPATITLGVGPGNSTGGGTVHIHVPLGAPTNHAPIVLGAVLVSNMSKTIGTASPSPSISIIPVPSISVGPTAGLPPSVAPTSATAHFFVQNTGNTPFSANVAVVNAAELEQLGWTLTLSQGSTPVTGPVSFSSGQSITFSVLLATSSYAQPPGIVVVQAADVNTSSNVVASATLTIPGAIVSIPHGLTITGPNVGSPPTIPDWGWTLIAVAPAVGFLAIVLTARWWRTRRWTRR